MKYSRASNCEGSFFHEDRWERKHGPRWRMCSREKYVSDSPMQELEPAYSISDPESIDAFLRNNRSAISLLKEAPAALSAAFGRKASKTLRLVEDDEGAQALFCFVAFAGSLADAIDALKSFDENWWLDRCAQVAGKLNFDFELV
jgi:hypothetical protein